MDRRPSTTTLLPQPRKIGCALAVIAGECDAMIDRPASERTARDYSAPLSIFRGCTHTVPSEADPAELAKAILG